MQIEQFIPSEYCKKCDTCCRFLEEESPYATGISLRPYGNKYICSNFDPKKNICRDYENRPLDCQLYPFVAMWDEDYRNVVLGIDTKCPYIAYTSLQGGPKGRERSEAKPPRRGRSNPLAGRLRTLRRLLRPSLRSGLAMTVPRYILRFQDDIEILGKLDILTEKILKRGPILSNLLIGDKYLFEKYASQADTLFSSYSFVSNYIWAGLLGYCWSIIDDNFCLFCKTADTIFMPIPPLGKVISKRAVAESFLLMDRLNKNKGCSRIEEIAKVDAMPFEEWGYRIKEKGREYIYRQKDLTSLAGDRYKAKRALRNYFVKNYKFEYRPFKKEDTQGCLELFKRWRNERTKVYKDGYYNALLEDSYLAHKKGIGRFSDLGIDGRVVEVKNEISAYIFGYPLNAEVFVILFEVSDLKVKGLAQFIFREFVKEQAGFEYINCMDDSGLENLKKVKLSYRPITVARTFCAYA